MTETAVVDKEAIAAQKLAEKQAKAQAAAAAKEQAKAQREQERAEKKAAKEAEKAAGAAEREAEKAAKLKAKEDAVAAREAAKAAKLQAKEDLKAAREAARQPEQNGIRRPDPSGVCGIVWGLADEISASLGQPVPIANLLEATTARQLDPTTTRCQYARWKKFHGLAGRITLPVAAAAE